MKKKITGGTMQYVTNRGDKGNAREITTIKKRNPYEIY